MMFRAWIVAAVAAAGCGRSGEAADTAATDPTETGGSTGAPTELDLDGFIDAAEAAYCAWQVECGEFGAAVRCRDVVHFEQELRLRLLVDAGSDAAVAVAYLREAIEVGRIAFDEQEAAACVAYVGARTCEVPWLHQASEAEQAGAAACLAVFKGRMDRNGPCLSALECAETAICGFNPSCTDMCCAGACRVLAGPIAAGEPCGTNPNRSCAEGTYCAQDPDTFMPTVCTPAPKLGQACANGACAVGAYCDYDQPTPICAAPRKLGSACYSDYECAQPAVCKHDQNFDNGVCFMPADQGGACDPSSPDLVCLRRDNYCAPDSKTCSPLPGNGEPCDYRCRGDLFCAQTGACVPVADAGEPCGYDNGEYVPCSGDSTCTYLEDREVCVAPTGAAPCPVPKDPLEGT